MFLSNNGAVEGITL